MPWGDPHALCSVPQGKPLRHGRLQPLGSCQHHGFRLGLGLSPDPTEQEIRKYLHTQSHGEGQAALWDCASILLGIIHKMSVAVHLNYTGR